MTGIRQFVQERAVSLIARSSVIALGLAVALAIAPAISASEMTMTSIAAPGDSSDAAAAVAAFHDALVRGDSLAVLGLLAPDVIIMEAGGIETLTEYRSHHLSGDIAYARAIPGVHSLRGVVIQGNTAWVSSTSVTEGQFNGRAVNSAGAELVVLSRKRAHALWMIRAVHWSSRRRTP